MFFNRFLRSRPNTDRSSRPADLVAAYKATGDLERLGELYAQYMELVYAVCFKYLRDEEESKDAVMQIFEQLITDLKRHEISNFQSWLHTVARNYCLMQLRARKITVGDDWLTDHSEADHADEQPGSKLTVLIAETDEPDWVDENLASLNGCLACLPPEQRVCIDLFYLQQKSYADVANLTGYDLKQVKSYLQNGRRNLKLCLDKHRG
jgi:RNA polymerase sigma-70 factor (ECF subfamily)